MTRLAPGRTHLTKVITLRQQQDRHEPRSSGRGPPADHRYITQHNSSDLSRHRRAREFSIMPLCQRRYRCSAFIGRCQGQKQSVAGSSRDVQQQTEDAYPKGMMLMFPLREDVRLPLWKLPITLLSCTVPLPFFSGLRLQHGSFQVFILSTLWFPLSAHFEVFVNIRWRVHILFLNVFCSGGQLGSTRVTFFGW